MFGTHLQMGSHVEQSAAQLLPTSTEHDTEEAVVQH